MAYQIRPLTADDRSAAWKLGSLAFGYHDHDMPQDWGSDDSGRRTWAVFDDSGRLVAKAVDREQGQWFGGRIVPTCGVAGVAVVPEGRGKGLARLVLSHLLAAARDRGAVISTLFPTTPFPYRRLGWQEVGALTHLAVPTVALTPARADAEVTLRPALHSDIPAIHELYRAAAMAGTGMMERSGPMFADDFLSHFDGVTLAVGPSQAVEGYASWTRGPGYDAKSKLTVYDLIGSTARATDTLLAMLASWESVAPTVVMRLSFSDPVMLSISSASARIESRQPWMVRLVDVVGAVAARGWPTHVEGRVDLELEDDVCPWNAGRYRLEMAGGVAKLEPGGTGEVQLTPRGLGLWYAGAVTPDFLRRAGFLSGGDARTDDLLRTATAGPPPSLQDYF